MSTLKSTTQVAEKLARSYQRNWRPWALTAFSEGLGHPRDGFATCPKTVALGQPTDAEFRANRPEMLKRIRKWHAITDNGFKVSWNRVAYKTAGVQELPDHLVLDDPDEFFRYMKYCGRTCTPQWKEVKACMESLAFALVKATGGHLDQDVCSALVDAMKAGQLYTYDGDAEKLAVCLKWMIGHDTSKVFARQMPVFGVDTKWYEDNRVALDGFFTAITGKRPEFRTPENNFTLVRFLDPEMRPYGITEISLPQSELVRVPAPRVLVICENRVNFELIPESESVLALWGGGYGVTSRVRDIPWIGDCRVLYWGDLDIDGFAILDELRGCVKHVESVLMDEETFERHTKLAVSDTGSIERINPATLIHLTEEERDVLNALERDGHCLRLEQERIEWEWAKKRLLERIKPL